MVPNEVFYDIKFCHFDGTELWGEAFAIPPSMTQVLVHNSIRCKAHREVKRNSAETQGQR